MENRLYIKKKLENRLKTYKELKIEINDLNQNLNFMKSKTKI